MEAGDIEFDDVMSIYNMRVVPCYLGTELAAFVYRGSDNICYIMINFWLDQEQQQKVLLHELKHILEDAPGRSYFIGLDMQEHEMEKEADRYIAAVNSG